MRKEDLRIGNYVMCNTTNEVGKISGNLTDVCFFGKHGVTRLYTEIGGVLITKEQLVDFGFEKGLYDFADYILEIGDYWFGISFLKQKDGYRKDFYEFRVFSELDEETITISTFVYIHQIQNIVYDLTGTLLI